MKNSGAYHRNVGDIGSCRPRALAHRAGLVGTGRLRKNSNLISAVDWDEGRKSKRAILGDRQTIAAVILQNEASTSSISGNRPTDGKRPKGAGDLNIDGDTRRGYATAVRDGAGLCRPGWLVKNSYIIGLANGDGGFELCGGIGPGDRKIISTIVLQNQACATETANSDSYGHGSGGARYQDAGNVGSGCAIAG